MIEDLLSMGKSAATADVAVIGAGTLGLPMAGALGARGLGVICLESGAETQNDEIHQLNEVVYSRAVYPGAAHGRFRCLGGTSTRWGGALIPFLISDVRNADWPVSHADIVAYRPAVERFFALSDEEYEADGLITAVAGVATHIARLAKWPRFAKRNVFNILEQEVRTRPNMRVIINATATDFEVEGGALRRIVARAPNGASITVHARKVVFAAGAIESTRLLLLLDQQNDSCLRRQGDQLGRNFHDHLSVPVASLKAIDQPQLNRLVGFRFERGGAMRNLRFELAENGTIRADVKPCFAHIAFEGEEGSGFASLREVFRHLQMRRVAPLATFVRLALDAPWLIRAVWWRFVEQRLLYPDNAKLNVHMVIEQEPVADNRIQLSPDKVDCFGRPLAQIDWSASDIDVENLRKATDAFEKAWNGSNLAQIAQFVRRAEDEAAGDLVRGGSICHPGGSTRMGRTPDTGVVDANLKVFGLSNLFVVATSVLPTGGGGNPTMMAAMLAFRCVDHLVSELAAHRLSANAFLTR
jgi:choline dehydrogenase-like flavoprotein